MFFDTRAFYHFQRRLLTSLQKREDFLMHWAVRELSERLSVVNRQFQQGVFYSISSSLVENTLDDNHKVVSIDYPYTDKIFDNQEFFNNFWLADNVERTKNDLIIAPFMLYPREDILSFLKNMHKSLKEDGLFLSVAVGEGSLLELQQSLLQAELQLTGGASARVASFPSLQAIGQQLSAAGFYLPVIDVEPITLCYNDLLSLVKDLRAMGMQNILEARNKNFAHPELFNKAAQIYAEKFSNEDGKINATFSFIFLSGWKAPLNAPPLPKPGSGKVSLQQALKDITE